MTLLDFTSTNQNALIAAEAKIADNADIPNGIGTTRWADVQKAIDSNLWFIPKPSLEGWGNTVIFTQAQMLSGVDMTDIVEQELNVAWFPPAPAMGVA